MQSLPLLLCVPLCLALAALAVAQDTRPAVDWRTPLNAKIEQHRKGDFTLRILDARGEPLTETDVTVEQVGHHFLFGTAIGGDMTSDNPNTRKYLDHIADHFNALVCENEMKWYHNEKDPDQWRFDRADAMVEFAQKHGLTVRGHCIFWAKDKFVQDWIKALDDEQLRTAMEERQDETVPRYAGRVMGWDVNNEMLDGHFFERRLGEDIRAWMFRRARELDKDAVLFVNDYALIGNRGRTAGLLEQVASLRKGGAEVGGIGVQEHGAHQFEPETGPDKITRTLDQLAAAGVPIHLTEVSVKSKDDARQAEALEVLLRTSFAHPKVEAFMLWGFWANRHWMGDEAGLVKRDWTPRPAFDLWKRLIEEEWHTRVDDARTDAEGRVEFRGFFGDYRVKWRDDAGTQHEATATLVPEALEAEARTER